MTQSKESSMHECRAKYIHSLKIAFERETWVTVFNIFYPFYPVFCSVFFVHRALFWLNDHNYLSIYIIYIYIYINVHIIIFCSGAHWHISSTYFFPNHRNFSNRNKLTTNNHRQIQSWSRNIHHASSFVNEPKITSKNFVVLLLKYRS